MCAFLERIDESLGFGKLNWFPVRSNRPDTILLSRFGRSGDLLGLFLNEL